MDKTGQKILPQLIQTLMNGPEILNIYYRKKLEKETIKLEKSDRNNPMRMMTHKIRYKNYW
jgi:hypothetical protein